jgi:hypothetical protein
MQRASPHAFPFAEPQNVHAANPFGQLATLAALASSSPTHQDESPDIVETFENTFAAWRFSVEPVEGFGGPAQPSLSLNHAAAPRREP